MVDVLGQYGRQVPRCTHRLVAAGDDARRQSAEVISFVLKSPQVIVRDAHLCGYCKTALSLRHNSYVLDPRYS